MRAALAKLNQQRCAFVATFKRYGSRKAYKGPPLKTVLLVDIVGEDSGEMLTDHAWFNFTEEFAKLGELAPGTVLAFEARVKRYVKGYRGRREDAWMENPPALDYKLSYPTKVRVKEVETG